MIKVRAGKLIELLMDDGRTESVLLLFVVI